MTTPPLDLPALREDLRKAAEHHTGHEGSPWWYCDPDELFEALDRLEAAERDLAAVTVSRDGWQTRAEAAEKKVAAVEALHTKDDRECAICRDAYGDYVHYPCPTITALDTHTPETETTP